MSITELRSIVRAFFRGDSPYMLRPSDDDHILIYKNLNLESEVKLADWGRACQDEAASFFYKGEF